MINAAENSQEAKENLLLRNAIWYCQLRWIVTAIFILLGIASFIPGLFGLFAMRAGILWPFIVGGILFLTNIGFLTHIGALIRRNTDKGIYLNLWGQIILDLVFITITVQKVGSRETVISFIYLFHIVLSCIFLSRAQSFIVAGLSCSLYVACLTLEASGLILPSSIFRFANGGSQMNASLSLPSLNILSFVIIIMVVWYLSSYLSSMVRARERDLEETNRHLIRIQEEKRRYMLQTTHELKAPFAAIQANSQLLAKGYCGDLPNEAQDVVSRISERSRRLAGMIQEMLQLTNLHSQDNAAVVKEEMDLGCVVESCVRQVRQIAEERSIQIKVKVQPTLVYGAEEHLKILFINLITNAVLYSIPEGLVEIEGHKGPGKGHITVAISDKGIGIPKDKLSKIFDEYYRTSEAVQHNKNATGLGLAIVKRIAELHRIKLVVKSEVGKGTSIKLTFPPIPRNGGRSHAQGKRKESRKRVPVQQQTCTSNS